MAVAALSAERSKDPARQVQYYKHLGPDESENICRTQLLKSVIELSSKVKITFWMVREIIWG